MSIFIMIIFPSSIVLTIKQLFRGYHRQGYIYQFSLGEIQLWFKSETSMIYSKWLSVWYLLEP